MPGTVTHLICVRCGTPADLDTAGCASCGGPLLLEYDLDAVTARLDPREVPRRAWTMWRYRELLPPTDPRRVVSLGEGGTPLLPLPTDLCGDGVRALWLKDESRNPTGTFKDRGAACAVTQLRTRGVTAVALPSAGNAGAAWAAYGAVAGLEVRVAVPADTPALIQREIALRGARLEVVDGSIADAAAHLAADPDAAVDVATFHEPYRVEGKKTLAFEIAEQLGRANGTPLPPWPLPDVVVAPAGGGVAVVALWRGFGQLLDVGWAHGPMPRLVAVQAAGCAPLVRAFTAGDTEVAPWPEPPRTIAAGLRVPHPRAGGLLLHVLRRTGGAAVAVTDDEILAAIATLARRTGLLACPEGAAAVAALPGLRAEGVIGAGERVVCLNTGSGLKYPEVLARVSTR